MLARFDRLSLRAKLTLGFVALIGLMLAGGGAALLSHRVALAAMESFLDRDNRIAELSLTGRAALGQARRYEKEFLLKVKEFGYEETKSRYATLIHARLEALREDMDAVRRLSDDPGMAQQTRTIEEIAGRYEAGFLKVVALHGRLGRVDTGLEGQFRDRAHAIESLLRQGAPERLMSGLLTLRRHEKDFIQRGTSRHADAFEAAATGFRQDVARSDLPSRRKAELLLLGDEYRALFREYVAVEALIDADTQAYLEEAILIEPLLEQFHARASRAAAETRHALHGLGAATAWTVVVAGLIAILLALLVAGFIVRNANRWIGGCVAFADRLAAGDWTARLPQAAGDNEFGTLAAALNHMADALLAAHGKEEAAAAEQQRLNRTLRMLSRCNETLVRAPSETDLLEGICHHIVETGGYRLAWVGFARDDAQRSVAPAAHAGEGGGYLDDLRISWADTERGRGPTGTAIREGRIVVTHSLASAPEFAPWRAEAAKRGYASSIALPLRGRDGVLGALNIYAAEAEAFDVDEVRLLRELADDLAFGIVSQRDATARARAEEALDYYANYDGVTGLANRNLFGDRLRQATLHTARSGRRMAVLMLGLDRFKAINDSLGHDAGDALLKHVGQSLAAALREGDTVARLSSGEFAVAMSDLARDEDAAPVAMKLLEAAMRPLTLNGNDIYTTASMGISVYPKDGTDAASLLQNADAALSSAKAMGGNLFHFYSPQMNESMAARFALESGLRLALERDELRVHYQPRVSLQGGEMTSAEALVRWEHPEAGMMPPAQFIPLAEETGLILPLGEWVINSVCRQLRAWLDAGLPVPPVAVNLSARQFRQKNLVQVVRQALRVEGLEARYLELEITESALMDDMEAAIATLRELKAIGVKLSLDDFGTGYSSLSHLKRLPIDYLKIDQSFVRELTTDPDAAAICLAIVGLAHNLKLTVIAEGVETAGQANYLRQQRCDEMQGYYFSRPVPAGEFERFMTQATTLALPLRPPEERRTLLLVDDEANILSALKRMLRRDGYEIFTAGSAREGFDILSTHAVQVIVSDQRMPEMNGTEFLSKVRGLYPDTIRMVLSGYTDLGTITESINRGAIYKFLTKPWDDEQLREQVREAFHHYDAARLKA